MSKNASESWLKFLNPDSLKQNLIRTSVYLTCWEMLKESIIEQPRDFFTHEFKDGKWIPSPDYKEKVLSLDKDPLIASALWFREHEVITDDDISLLRVLRQHRNEIAHELLKFLGTVECQVQSEFFTGVRYLLSKIDKWWIQEVDIPTNPDFDNQQLTDDQREAVMSMRMVFMQLLIPVAEGNDAELKAIYEEMKRRSEPKK